MPYFPFIAVAIAFLSLVVTSVMGQCFLECSCLVVHNAGCTKSSLSEIPQSGSNQHLTNLNACFNMITILRQDYCCAFSLLWVWNLVCRLSHYLQADSLFTAKLHCLIPFAPLFNAEILFRASVVADDDFRSAGVSWTRQTPDPLSGTYVYTGRWLYITQ